MNLDSIRAKIERAREIHTYLLQSPSGGILLARVLRDTISRAHHAWIAGRVSSPAYRHLDRWIDAYSAAAGECAKAIQLALRNPKKARAIWQESTKSR